MNTKLSRNFAVLLVILLNFTSLVVFNVNAQPTPTPTPGNWSKVAIFADSRSGYHIITDSFTCDHVEWRITWNADLNHMHFDISNYIMQIVIFPEGTSIDYLDVINGSLSFIFDSGDRAGGTHVIHGNAGTFYLRIATSPYVDSYGILVEQNTDSPTPIPTIEPTATPTPTTTSSPRSAQTFVAGTDLVVSIAIIAVIGVGILTYFKKYRK